MRQLVADAEREPERELPPQAPLCARQVLEPGEGGAELGEGLRERRAGEGAAPGPLVVVDRLLRQPRLAEVVREQLGLGLGGLREALLEDLRNPRVELLPAADQQAAVGGVLHQRVLE